MVRRHVPVLVDRVVQALAPAAPGLLVDVTVGAGGHAAALLAAAPGFILLGLDRDPEVLAVARRTLTPYRDRVTLESRTFDQLPEILDERDLPRPAALLADLGCSSLQLDEPERGFSFAADGPLDMRMGSDGPTAADIVNEAPEEELVRILFAYGEERRSRAIARALIRRRATSRLSTTGELSRLVAGIVGRSRGPGRIHPATRTFQALRIAVNDELGQLERFLEPSVRRLRPGGRVGVISFHSLEDRIVKHTLRRLEGRCICPPDLPDCVCGPERVLRLLGRGPVRPDESEVVANPRARSARARFAERVGGD